ncbi:cytochrome b [Salmonella enterica]|uniref:cytochrome b n=1 Tax=Salmonella enterica TaxID=28901 RepID=UPI003D186C04
MTKFSGLQIQLHWLTLLLIAVTYAAMEFRGIFPKGSAAYLAMRETHYNAGVFTLLLMFVRLSLYRKYPSPAILPSPPQWQEKAAKMMHRVLYATFLLLPLLGVAIMAFGGKDWSFLGMSVPVLMSSDHEIKSALEGIHETLANAGYFFIAAHAAAALFHHYVQRDNTLIRMLPGRINR